MKILIVDDNEDSLLMLESLLSGDGYEVAGASNGREALAAAEEDRPDLIISDILMPEMDGFELCRRVKSDPALRTIPLVFYTATYTDPKDEELARASGASRFLIKPLEPLDLLAAIRQTLDEYVKGGLSVPDRPWENDWQLKTRHNQRLLEKLTKRSQELAEARQRAVEMEARAQELTIASEQARHADDIKAEFLSYISHELRTPLNAVIGFSDLMVHEIHGPIQNEHYAEYAQVIHGAADYLLGLVNEVLDISAIEAGKLRLTEDAIVLHDLVSSCIGLMQGQASAASVEIREQVENGVVPRIQADNRRLKQIILNLLSNAIKYTPPGGHVEISCQCLDNGSLAISVSDSGIGMSTEEVSQALLPFGRIISNFTRSREGVGLGLPLSKTLAEAHGASFDIHSQTGAGTTVTITLPAERVLEG